ncbi:MAG: type I-E CRISPR-associated protein Cas6/Cse3/CasE [Nocardiopsaceae bacterium]|nr:type I-E CRISPR-associated protein Cas6/Cse3/CasE [Nocardiopsaceae bacterium]
MSTWLTQLTPDFRSRQARRDLGNAAEMHRTIMKLVPDSLSDEPRREAGVLYRIEETRRGPQIIVQTQVKPDPARLPAGYGPPMVRNLDPLLAWLQPGTLIRYRLTANTCLRKSATKEVVPLRGADAENWWITRAPAAGIELQSLTSRSPGDAVGRKPGQAVRHALTQFDGVAAVTDPTALTAAIITGIGRGKSHGCGLLSIAPLGAAA